MRRRHRDHIVVELLPGAVRQRRDIDRVRHRIASRLAIGRTVGVVDGDRVAIQGRHAVAGDVAKRLGVRMDLADRLGGLGEGGRSEQCRQ